MCNKTLNLITVTAKCHNNLRERLQKQKQGKKGMQENNDKDITLDDEQS